MARIVRGKMLQLKDQEFALASRSAILCLIMISFTLFGDGLRDAFDPRMRK